jgi:hypothetical protein
VCEGEVKISSYKGVTASRVSNRQSITVGVHRCNHLAWQGQLEGLKQVTSVSETTTVNRFSHTYQG